MTIERRIGVGDFKVTPAMYSNIARVLDTGRLSYGPFCREFESKFAAMHGCSLGVVSNSGTSSLQVALQTLKEIYGWRDGDEVIVPAVTFVATVNVVLHNRLKPVLVDVESDYYGIDASLISSAITDRTVCIIPVHTFGQPCDMPGVLDAIDYYNNNGRCIHIVEDSCESVLASIGMPVGMPVGQWGSIGVFSSYVAHILTTGVGGIATTNNSDYAAKMRSLVNHGRDGIYISIDDDDNCLDEEHFHEVISRRFNFESVGHSFRITELEAALACAQLNELPANVARRRATANTLTNGLQEFEDQLQLPAVRPGAISSWMMYPIVLLRECSKWDLCNYLEERGIETREMLRLTDQPCYRGMWNPDDYPVAQWINRQGYYVGCHPGLEKSDLDCIIRVHKDFFKGK